MVKSFQGKRALLVGNGINRLDSNQSFSWSELLQELKDSNNIDVDLDNIFKPFPLAFEEMLHRKSGGDHFNDKIKSLKQQIRRSIDRQLQNKEGFNEYHTKLVTLGYDDILTTNYDYSLQNSVDKDFLANKRKRALNKEETRHSLKRKYKLPSIYPNIWHIHGELRNSRSTGKSQHHYEEETIMLGYEHYASYLEKIQEKIKGKSGIQKDANQSLMVRLKNDLASSFWIDIFFTHNVDIVGQAFDFSENHLWWLVNCRANAMRQIRPKYGIEINNTIQFFYPQIISKNHDEAEGSNKKDSNKLKAIAEILMAFNVVPKMIVCKSHKDFYDQITSVLPARFG